MTDEIEMTKTNDVVPSPSPSPSSNRNSATNKGSEDYKLEVFEAEEAIPQPDNTEAKQSKEDEEDDDDDESGLIGYCKFVVSHHRLAFGITLGLHILMILITVVLFAAGYDILPIDFEQLPLNLEEDSTKLRTDAWVNVRDDDSVSRLIGEQKKRSIEYQTISLNYELKSGNVFTKANLLAIKKSEDELFKNGDYKSKLCQMEYTNTSSKCRMPLSILRFFDGTYEKIDSKLNDPDFTNIPLVLQTAQSKSLSNAILNFHLGKNAVINNNTVSSSYTRSLLYTGWPIDGYNTTEDNDEDQEKEINKRIVSAFASDLEKKYKDGIEDMNFYYNNIALSSDAIQQQVVLDMMLAVASFVFIFLFMWLQTGSVWLTSWGIFSVVSSFNITNLIYRIVFDYRYIGIFHVLSIFIILGIGSDNIFVFMDTWKQSTQNLHKTLAHRLSSVYSGAAKATLITSFTTMMAFLSNVQSPLLAMSSFGLFAAILVVVNYASVVLFFPTVIIMHHSSRRGRCCCGPMCGSRQTDHAHSAENLADHDEGETKKSVPERIIHFFEGWFFENIISHKIVRWVVIAFFTIIMIVSIVFATQLEPDTEQINPWKSDTNWGQVQELGKSAFRPSQEDQVVIVHIIWGLREQDRSQCHHTDFKCKGKTVFDKSYDLNPPPCQTAMLKLCNKIKKNLTSEQEDKLKLRRSQVTKEIEIECIVDRMNEYLTDEGKKTEKYKNGSDFSFPINAEKMTALMYDNPAIFNDTLPVPATFYRYFEVGLGYFVTQGGDPFFASSFDYDRYIKYVGGQIDPSSIPSEERSFGQGLRGNQFGHRTLYLGIAVNTTMKPTTLGYENGLPIYDNWEEFVNNEMENMPSSCNSGFQATVSYYNVWHWLKVQEILVNNAMMGIAVGLVLALVVLTIATTNIIVGIMATVTIGMVTAGVLGLIPILGWKLGLFESLNLTLVVGLAVDYVVHLAEGYMELKDEDRLTRVRYTLGHVGISVASGACTTLGSSIFMLAAKIVFFSQFGIFIFCTIGLSILYSLFLFTTVLALIGPEGDTGSLKPLMKKIKNYVRGQTKDHVECETCKGKGFHKKTAECSSL